MICFFFFKSFQLTSISLGIATSRVQEDADPEPPDGTGASAGSSRQWGRAQNPSCLIADFRSGEIFMWSMILLKFIFFIKCTIDSRFTSRIRQILQVLTRPEVQEARLEREKVAPGRPVCFRSGSCGASPRLLVAGPLRSRKFLRACGSEQRESLKELRDALDAGAEVTHFDWKMGKRPTFLGEIGHVFTVVKTCCVFFWGGQLNLEESRMQHEGKMLIKVR